jgi:3-dehydroquinate synthase
MASPSPGSPAPSDLLRQRLSVPFEYSVGFTEEAFASDNSLLLTLIAEREPAKRHRVLVVIDSGVLEAWPNLAADVPAYFARHASRIELVGPPELVIGGESSKNDPALIQRLHGLFQARHMDRHSFVLILGGGSVLDAVGFAAATCHRGLRVIRMPTTVLGQADSGVGVKNGVNAFGAKNFIGTFAPPYAVLNDLRLLDRLSLRDRIAGQAEAVKVALIRDAGFFGWLEAGVDRLAACEPEALGQLVRRCAELHLRHIGTGGDPVEMGSARPLDFGHWAAHKLESLTAHELRHGEAVAIGVLLDSRYCVEAGLLPLSDFERIFALLQRLGLPCWHDQLVAPGRGGRPALFDGLDEFREHLGGELTVTLLRGIGNAEEVHALEEVRIRAALSWLEAHARSAAA